MHVPGHVARPRPGHRLVDQAALNEIFAPAASHAQPATPVSCGKGHGGGGAAYGEWLFYLVQQSLDPRAVDEEVVQDAKLG